MNTKQLLRQLSLLPLFVVCGWAQAPVSGGFSLKTLTQVKVAVFFNEGQGTGAASEKVLAKDLGLHEGTLQIETELRLREAGFKVFQPASPNRDSYPSFTIQISSAGIDAVSIEVALTETATLDRSSLRAWVTTWSYGAILQGPTSTSIRQAIRDSVSVFLNQWLADRQ
jgi:hypothetical protein